MILGTSRKAIAAAIGGLVGYAGHYIPGLSDLIGPEIINLASLVLSVLGSYFITNRVAGFNVNDLAKFVLDAMDGEAEVTSLNGQNTISGDFGESNNG